MLEKNKLNDDNKNKICGIILGLSIADGLNNNKLHNCIIENRKININQSLIIPTDVTDVFVLILKTLLIKEDITDNKLLIVELFNELIKLDKTLDIKQPLLLALNRYTTKNSTVASNNFTDSYCLINSICGYIYNKITNRDLSMQIIKMTHNMSSVFFVYKQFENILNQIYFSKINKNELIIMPEILELLNLKPITHKKPATNDVFESLIYTLEVFFNTNSFIEGMNYIFEHIENSSTVKTTSYVCPLYGILAGAYYGFIKINKSFSITKIDNYQSIVSLLEMI